MTHERPDERLEPADPDVAAMLRRLDAPAGEPDWARLQAAIARRVRGRPGARRGASWWDYAARWSRAAVPIGLAAGILAAVALGSADRTIAGERLAQTTAATMDSATLLVASADSASRGALLDGVIGLSTPEAMLTEVVQR